MFFQHNYLQSSFALTISSFSLLLKDATQNGAENLIAQLSAEGRGRRVDGLLQGLACRRFLLSGRGASRTRAS